MVISRPSTLILLSKGTFSIERRSLPKSDEKQQLQKIIKKAPLLESLLIMLQT